MPGSGYGGSPLVALAVRAASIPVVLALLPSGCFFHLDDPIPVGATGGASGDASGGDSGAGGAPSSGGAAGSTSGGASAGGGSGAAAAGGAANCPTGKKRCGTDCVQIDDPAFGCSPNDNECARCAQVDTAKTSCSSGMCIVDGCKDGFGDCDADDGNGCEIEFAKLPQTSGPIDSAEAFRTSMPMAITVDGVANDADWTANAARRLRINDVCRNCSNQYPLPVVVDPALPRVNDLDAWFRMAWDDFSLYAVVEVRDDELVPAESQMAGSDLAKLGPSVVEDAVELLISLDRAHGGFGEADMQLFYGIDGTVQRPNQSVPPPVMLPNKFVVTKGRGCYTVELELRFSYIANKQYTPTPGQMIAFTAAINDWDYRQADGGRIAERQSHIFSKDPRDQYWFNADNFGTLTLGPQ